MLIKLLLGVLLVCSAFLFYRILNPKRHHDYIDEAAKFNQTVHLNSMMDDHQAVDLLSLSDQTFKQKIEQEFRNIKLQLGARAELKIILFALLVAFACYELNSGILQANLIVIIILGEIIAAYLALGFLKKREMNAFEDSFPIALNIMTSAVSAGESVMHAVIHVGNNLEGPVGKEFRLMGNRLQMGEAPDEVFRKSCRRFPYRAFYFFVITLRANMRRGGQLKDVMSKLNRIMFNARAIDKKKMAMTSEARASAKIVAAIPCIFMVIMRMFSPENFHYVMTDPTGRYILYYLIASEFTGISIIVWLMKGVK
ncbi:type II secretion system F family protein [Vibrio neonatus]|uniref:type II secretion system F family protein n=1 Tax=Vibrio neonatus TaxID=278860 RepID=UPI0021C2EED6|nr:type II secretion system F family protein [Vibrio neonatus]